MGLTEPYLLEDLGLSMMTIVERHWYLICLCRACPWEELGVAASTHEKEVEVLLHMAEGSVDILINNPAVGTEGQLPLLALNV